MKKKIFIIAGMIAITFLTILGFETKTMQKNSIEETQKEMEVIAEDVKDITKIEVDQKQQENTEKTTTETTTKTEYVISQKETKKSEIVSQPKQEQKSKNENKTSEKEEVKSNNTQQTESNTSTPVEKDVVKEQEIIEEKPQEEVKEEIVVEEKEVDEEYERLLKEVEYATYDECMKAGFEIAFSDTVNILGFDPIEVIYKGQVLGYKLKIHYTNPMEN